MKSKCDSCLNRKVISVPVSIYSGEFCSIGNWDERGCEYNNSELSKLTVDLWRNCKRYNPIKGANNNE